MRRAICEKFYRHNIMFDSAKNTISVKQFVILVAYEVHTFDNRYSTNAKHQVK